MERHSCSYLAWVIALVSFTSLPIKYNNSRSARFQCAAICTRNPTCVAYFYKGSECHEASGIGLIGAMPDSPTALTVYIDRSLDPGNSALMKLTHIINIQYFMAYLPQHDFTFKCLSYSYMKLPLQISKCFS